MEAYLGTVLIRFAHIFFGILWIGLLYYFNFVQTEYFKESEASAKADVVQKLVPNALWYFRWAAAFTFLTGFYLLYFLSITVNIGILLGALMGTIMAANVWFIIWPNQKKVIAGAPDAADAGAKAGLASRTNTLLSIPMLYLMVYSAHGGGLPLIAESSLMGLWIGLVFILAIEVNALVGKMNPAIASVKAVIHSGIVLTLVFGALVHYF
ncbi:urate hydroxylase PuuD [Gammaproteobacteria bacterium]|nr:urate hydroxylase PuuD [Gammaproteobacteria bacterium]MDA7851752.1 urate hydroxylase PuuD [Gammaproteobacteria bacterium]MDA8925425.1 urate hydroxylase PuuD [Gammaproteobacteria bacterium]MDA9371392.1 urate hydroxylase PuuD [Gammaproteobacteria bacterium]MDA9974155.1 urate hydroxylase PuuD [Gammaproteobacteria bacterium]